MTQKNNSSRTSFLHLAPHIPFAPSRSPVFYGWVILFVGSLGVVMSAPGQTIGVSAFTDLLIRDLGISQNHLSLAYLIGTLSSSFILSYAGIAYDRYGARTMGAIVSVALGCVLLGLSLIPNIISILHTTFNGLPISPVTFVLLCLGFFTLRFFGQGALTLVSRNMVLKWFRAAPGLCQCSGRSCDDPGIFRVAACLQHHDRTLGLAGELASDRTDCRSSFCDSLSAVGAR